MWSECKKAKKRTKGGDAGLGGGCRRARRPRRRRTKPGDVSDVAGKSASGGSEYVVGARKRGRRENSPGKGCRSPEKFAGKGCRRGGDPTAMRLSGVVREERICSPVYILVSCFIENYGTHIVTSATIGGRDVVYVRQHQLSPLSSSDIENYVKDIGDQRFLDPKSQPTAAPLKYKDKASIMHCPALILSLLLKDVTVIFRRRGGDDLEQSHAKWSETVELAPDFKCNEDCTITCAAYKPPIEDLQYFLEFQIARVWAPELNKLQRKEPVCPSLQFSLMGPKLYISPDQVTVGRKPVTGLRLSLEGSKQNRLAIHLQHLVSLPKILQPHWDAHMAIGAPKWQGPEEQDSRWFEPIKWKNFSHVSTAPIEHTEICIGDLSGVHIVTGAQLGVWDFGAKSVLHLKLLFSKVPGCTIRRSVWDHSPSTPSTSQKPDGSSSSLSNEKTEDKKGDSSSQTGKLIKIVDLTEMSKGPQDIPGHWLVTGAKLGVDKGKIVLRIKYSLLNY
ncbi:MACPF domain-containing protein CAD1 [Vitis vinifera]|uniref:MACPF domain-containing protein CAD1 n=1 Tax=Vitis vinifera TaxID=29760 RepID=A0A438H383_VITVI|nr:MACPF domain-containing protein CAD1 [Vitis vinifera]